MTLDERFIAQLIDIGTLIERRQTLEEGLRDLAALTAQSLGAARCSVMLLMEADDPGGPRLRVYSHFGNLPKEAYASPVDMESSIAGGVAMTGEPLLTNHVGDSSLADLADQGEAGGDSLMSAPIVVAGHTIGVMNVSQPTGGRSFTEQDLDLFKVFSMFVAKSIHVFQLQKLSESRVLQMSQVLQQRDRGQGAKRPISPDPQRLAKMVAKNFYRELSLAGFGPNAIIAVASEVLGQLNETISKHRSRMERRRSS
jgi:signal transduction protein with GAF and PtsI domain